LRSAKSGIDRVTEKGILKARELFSCTGTRLRCLKTSHNWQTVEECQKAACLVISEEGRTMGTVEVVN
jgi:hypothetical protein